MNWATVGFDFSFKSQQHGDGVIFGGEQNELTREHTI